MNTWLKSLKPIPSPHLVNGQLSPAAKRGEKLFRSAQTRCASCHPPGLFTDLHHYDVGTLASTDKTGDTFDTPTLVEIWRHRPLPARRLGRHAARSPGRAQPQGPSRQDLAP